MPPRKSIGAASGGSTPSTPVGKSGARKSLGGASVASPAPADGEPSTSTASASAAGGGGLSMPAEAKSVLLQQKTALKSLSLGLENFELPRTNVIKTAKAEIPDSVQLRKEVQQALVKSASVFISYLTATAHEHATKKGGKIISAQHVLEAVAELDLGEGAVKTLKEELKAYRENVQQKKVAKKTEGKTVEGEGEGANDADVSRIDGADEEGDVTTRTEGDDGDASLLRNTMNGTNGAHDDDEDEEDQDQLMDED